MHSMPKHHPLAQMHEKTLKKDRADIIPLLSTSMPSDIYFRVLGLYLCCVKNVWYLMPESLPYVQQLQVFLNSQRGNYFWHAFKTTIWFIIYSQKEDLWFKTLSANKNHHDDELPNKECVELRETLNDCLKTLLQSLEVHCPFLDLEKYNPYEQAFRFLLEPNLSEVIRALLIRFTPDVLIVDKSKNSLLNKVIEWNEPKILDLILDKLEQCSLSLAHPNEKGNTPLHTAFLNGASLKTVSKLIEALKTQKEGMDTLNQEGFSPLYLAIRANRIPEALLLLASGKVSVTHQYTDRWGGKETAFSLWIKNCINLSNSIEKNMRSLHFAIQLLERGSHYIEQYKNQYKQFSTNSLAQTQNDLYSSFSSKLNSLDAAWKSINSIIVGRQPTCFEFYTQIEASFSNTARLPDNKTMFEIIFEYKRAYDSTQNAAQHVQDRISFLTKILSLLIINGANIKGNQDENLKLCAKIAQEMITLKNDHELFLSQVKNQPMPEDKEAREAFMQVITDEETSCRERGKQICELLETLQHKDYLLFKALIYYNIVKCLFQLDKKANKLQIFNATLLFCHERTERAIALTKQFETEDFGFKPMIENLYEAIILYIPQNPHERMKQLLKELIPPEAEQKFAKEKIEELYTRLSACGDGALELDTTPCPVYQKLANTFERMDKEIETLKEENETLKKARQNSDAEKELLKKRIASFETQLISLAPTPGPLLLSQKRADDIDSTSCTPPEKRQKTEPKNWHIIE